MSWKMGEEILSLSDRNVCEQR